MKLMYTLLLICFINMQMIPQNEPEAAGELVIHVKNNIGNLEIKIEVQLISSVCWDAISEFPDSHSVTTEYPGSYQITSSSSATFDWEACWSTSYEHMFGLGKYRVIGYKKINGEFESTDYFDIDYRTSDLSENFNAGGGGDVHVDFNAYLGIFYYQYTSVPFPTSSSIWYLKDWIEHDTNELEPLPPDNFQLASSSGYPYLTWSHSSNSGDYLTGYEIYRSIVSGHGTPPGYFSKIVDLSASSTNYTDTELNVGGPLTAYYKVAAINGERLSNFTSTLSTYAGFNKANSNVNLKYQISQNYPNPFNPTTIIKYQIPQKSTVSIKVFDILGNEVSELVNEKKEAGFHEVNFNADNLSDGIYLYRIQADNFVDVKKFVLIK